jgi:hypothetical protein
MWTMQNPRRYDHCTLGCPSDLLPDDKWAHLEPLISMAKLRTITSHEVMKRYMRLEHGTATEPISEICKSPC